MAFNFKPGDGGGNGGGDFKPYIKYNAKAGRWYYRNEGDTNEREIVSPEFAFDMANLKSGWIYYATGKAPVKVPDPSPGCQADRPADNYKRGFWIDLWNRETGIRELSSSAAAVIGPMCEMYYAVEQELPRQPGMVPVFKCVGVEPVKGKKDTNFRPQFKLTGWMPRASSFGNSLSGPAPAAPSSNGHVLTVTQAFEAYKKAAGALPIETIKSNMRRDCEYYFGIPFDPKTVTGEQWAKFVADEFVTPKPPLAPTGTAMDEDSIPF
jgi:hypothetical protein